jgi:hypothetical protein
VVRQKHVDARLLTIASRGVGLQILDAPAAYYQKLVGSESAPRRQEPAAIPTPAGGRSFRVRAASGARSRILKIEAESADQARTRALTELGAGWEVLEVSSA